MKVILNSHNVFNYLVAQNLFNGSEQPPISIETLAAKNFNLLLTFADSNKLLVKQERHNHEGKAAGEFLIEWKIQKFFHKFPDLNKYRLFLPEMLHFDPDNSIIVLRYLADYQDLMNFYNQDKNFSTKIATAIGTILGTIHRDTFNVQEYQEFFTQGSVNFYQISHLIQGLERIEPEIFGLVPDDGLKFFTLYQRYDSLGLAIAELGNAVIPSCLTHNDLKLNNILLQKNYQDSNNIIRLIDWERSSWGDPAFNLGTIISSYLQMWLNSLVISNSFSIEESLRLAMIPLELLQPSIGALTLAYLNAFPEILIHRSDFLQRVIQFVGFALIQQIHAMIQYQKSFGNTGIVMLQVAKTLLSSPVQSMPTLFGAAAVELMHFNHSTV
jgi:tRNA A-37 threonylcarbamoyl transferase component Bud32